MKRLIKVQYRRRRQNKTDYLARRRMLESEFPRLVIRKTNRYIIAQIIKSKEAQDKVICDANSKELLEYGWGNFYSIKNLGAAYSTGYLCAIRTLKKGIKKAILDLGLQMSTKGNKIYAAVKGANDAGLEVPCSEDMLPGEERLKINAKVIEKIKKSQ